MGKARRARPSGRKAHCRRHSTVAAAMRDTNSCCFSMASIFSLEVLFRLRIHSKHIAAASLTDAAFQQQAARQCHLVSTSTQSMLALPKTASGQATMMMIPALGRMPSVRLGGMLTRPRPFDAHAHYRSIRWSNKCRPFRQFISAKQCHLCQMSLVLNWLLGCRMIAFKANDGGIPNLHVTHGLHLL